MRLSYIPLRVKLPFCVFEYVLVKGNEHDIVHIDGISYVSQDGVVVIEVTFSPTKPLSAQRLLIRSFPTFVLGTIKASKDKPVILNSFGSLNALDSFSKDHIDGLTKIE